MKNWKNGLAIFAVIVLLACVVWVAMMTFGRQQHKAESGRRGQANASRLSVHYAHSPNIYHQQLGQQLRQWGAFDAIARELDNAILLPRNLEIWFEDCHKETAFYDHEKARIDLCYELISDLVRGYARYAGDDSALAAAVWDTTFFVFYHELGHALIRILDLPASGREEDVADQLATWILVNGGDVGRDAALQGASWFWLTSRRPGHRTLYWDSHSLDPQRYYNILCWVYGSAPKVHQALLGRDWGLPSDRAEACVDEYQRMAKAFDSMLAPHGR